MDKARRLTTLTPSTIKVLAFDISFRETGYAKLNIKSGESELLTKGVFANPPLSMGFHGLLESTKQFQANTKKKLEKLIYEPVDLIIIEMPAFSQSAKSALAIGMCWGALAEWVGHEKVIFVEPRQLKVWSQSKAGDAKNKVKEKVLSRLHLGRDGSNDNIVDAVGLCLMFSDMVTQCKYDQNTP